MCESGLNINVTEALLTKSKYGEIACLSYLTLSHFVICGTLAPRIKLINYMALNTTLLENQYSLRA